jgi:YD repeat-containing protein
MRLLLLLLLLALQVNDYDSSDNLIGYNTEEQLTGLRNEAGEEYAFGRDGAGRIIAEKGFDGVTRTYRRDTLGLVRRVESPGNRSADYVYDNMNRLCGVEYSDGSFEQYAYDDDGRLREAKNANSHLKITRDKLGHVVEEWQDVHTITSSYDKNGRRAGITSSLGADLSVSYTADDRLAGMKSGEWEMSLQYDSRGLEIERVLSGGVVCRSQYDLAGRFHRQVVSSGGRETRRMRYDWSSKDRLLGKVDELARHGTWFDYDSSDNLIGSTRDETEKLFRLPDAVGNLYRRADRKDRKYGAGGRLLETENTKYHYDEAGNIGAKVVENSKIWRYKWNANGSLRELERPDRRTVAFE